MAGHRDRSSVILLVRMWVEKLMVIGIHWMKTSHPPCEDVSWKAYEHSVRSAPHGHPPCEDVSWKDKNYYCEKIRKGHPPCEDVSWKGKESYRRIGSNGHPPCEDVSWKIIDPPEEDNDSVILLVRMWVEKHSFSGKQRRGWSSSLWGCELKNLWYKSRLKEVCHPPCEDVSWKAYEHSVRSAPHGHPPCEDVSWKAKEHNIDTHGASHPPCEDVSWKNSGEQEQENKNPSSSLWGCELKMSLKRWLSFPPIVILLVRMWVEKYLFCEDLKATVVILLVRMWVEKRYQ